ncbi:hypothetical protein ACH5RR_034572 [Cinchona calisaya]|uniref:Uncharacterized protein n=1 Tax=Cinchona calisaya TaxID=153742 RepID=A0ABD2YDG3_9GENT
MNWREKWSGDLGWTALGFCGEWGIGGVGRVVYLRNTTQHGWAWMDVAQNRNNTTIPDKHKINQTSWVKVFTMAISSAAAAMKKTHVYRLLRGLQALHRKMDEGHFGLADEEKMNGIIKELLPKKYLDVRTVSDLETVVLLRAEGFDGSINLLGGIKLSVGYKILEKASELGFSCHFNKKIYSGMLRLGRHAGLFFC